MATLSGTNTGVFKGALVRAFHRDSGRFVGETISDASTGVWSITTTYSGKHFAVCHAGSSSLYLSHKIAIPFTGANNSTTAIDACGGTVAFNANAKIVTTQTDPFGGSGGVAYLPATTDSLGVSNLFGGTVACGDFHYRVWVYPTSFPSNAVLTSGGAYGLSIRKNGATNMGLVHENVEWHGYGSSDVPLNTWTCVQARRSGTTVALYYGSTSVFSKTYSTCYTTATSLGLASGFVGYVCDFELLNYADSVTPPTVRLTTLPSASENALIYDDLTPA
jgi:hypothetical protein